MIEPRMIHDPYVRRKIYNMIKKRITDAKIGVINVHGNYSIISGDPYALCQSMFGLPVTGLLRSGEIYRVAKEGNPDAVLFPRAHVVSCEYSRYANSQFSRGTALVSIHADLHALECVGHDGTCSQWMR